MVAANLFLPGQAIGNGFCSNLMPRLPIISPPLKKTYRPICSKLKLQQLGISEQHGTGCLKQLSRRNFPPVMCSISDTPSLSSSKTIENFFTCINDNRLEKLPDLLSEDCCFEDYAFSLPFQGKKEVVKFLCQLIASMGKHLKFRVGKICEGENYAAGVTWELEWKDLKVPFTRGSSFYECSEEGGTLVIKKAHVLIESPIKPGHLVLALLKALTLQSDEYPDAAEWFLKRSQTVLGLLQQVYNIFEATFIKPILACCINIWNFITVLLKAAINILLFTSNYFP